MAIMVKTVAEVVLEQLSFYGVKRIYGVVGDTIIGLLDALDRQDEIEFIAVKHESAAAFMASAEAKLTGRVAVCTATMGPGAANLLNGLGDAYSDRAPVLAITGQAPTNKIGTDFQQYVDQQQLFKPFAAYSANLNSSEAIVDLLQKAVQVSELQRTVSHLSIPKDLFQAETKAVPRPLPEVIKGTGAFGRDDLAQAVSIMKEARQPMILAGAGAQGEADVLEELAEAWGAGLLTSLGGKGILPDSAPALLQGIGEGGNPYAAEVFKESDIVLLAGVSWWPEGYVPEGARIIQVDAHLENARMSIPAELGIKGQTEHVLPLLLQGIEGHKKNSDWTVRIAETKERWADQNEQEGNKGGVPIHPSRIVRALERIVADDAILALDTGDNTVWMNRNFRQSRQKLLFSGYWRSMGFGLPAAMAAKLEYPEKQTVAVCGDGGIEMTMADLLTAVRYDLDITAVIFNNGALQMETDKIKASGDREHGTKLTNPDFVRLAEACGWKGFRADSETELEAVLEQAIRTKGPVLVDVPVSRAFFPETE